MSRKRNYKTKENIKFGGGVNNLKIHELINKS